MNIGAPTSYNFLASLTADLSDGSRQQFQNVSGDVAATPTAASDAATAAACSEVMSRLGQSWPELQSVQVNSLDIYA